MPIIPGKRRRKKRIRHDERRDRERSRIATRSDKPARNDGSAVAVAAVIAFWF